MSDRPSADHGAGAQRLSLQARRRRGGVVRPQSKHGGAEGYASPSFIEGRARSIGFMCARFIILACIVSPAFCGCRSVRTVDLPYREVRDRVAVLYPPTGGRYDDYWNSKAGVGARLDGPMVEVV